MEIKDKTVLVTGASSGMGAAIAKEMALAGADELFLLARNENELEKVAAEIASLGGKARFFPVDLSNPDQVTAIAKRIEQEAVVPDIIVNNAGSGLIRVGKPDYDTQTAALAHLSASAR